MKDSRIEWCDHTFNPWRGCTKVSPGCAHCYAETLSKRNPKVLGVWGKGQPRVRASKDMWQQPLKWNEQPWICDSCWTAHSNPSGPCMKAGCESETRHRARVFCASLADWLDDEVPIEWLADLLNLIRQTPNLDWLLLTKRPQNWKERIRAAFDHARQDGRLDLSAWIARWLTGTAPANVWMGTTVEDQARADERIPHLLRIPARVRFLSCEPLLGPVEFSNVSRRADWKEVIGRPALEGIHWVIGGGESGPKARPMHPDWARSLRDQCAAASVPFFFKQWGQWWTFPGPRDLSEALVLADDGTLYRQAEIAEGGSRRQECWEAKHGIGPLTSIYKVGKKVSGRHLDGVEHNAFPV